MTEPTSYHQNNKVVVVIFPVLKIFTVCITVKFPTLLTHYGKIPKWHISNKNSTVRISLVLHHKLCILYLLLCASDVNDAISGARQCLINRYSRSRFLADLSYATTGLSDNCTSQLQHSRVIQPVPIRIMY